jgi:hypothetical protein
MTVLPASAAAAVPAGAAAQHSNVAALTNARYMDAFVKRSRSRLTVAGRPFRFSGANVEFLGLENYGINSSKTVPVGSERYPSRYEVDDALATAHEMGATVIRAQTLGDTVGCALCIEPRLGRFNQAAFAEMDMVVAEARRYGIKLFGEFDGDATATSPTGRSVYPYAGHNWYCTWRRVRDCAIAFFSDPRLLGDYERHMHAVLDHVNPLTGLAYKNDPTFAGWVDGNNLNLLDGVPPPIVETWLAKVSAYFKSIDSKQLFADISRTGGDVAVTPTALQIPGIDIYGQEYYPHWFPILQGGDRIDGTAPLLHLEAAQIAAAGKAYATLEYGWDHTNHLSVTALRRYLHGLAADHNVAGDGSWALQAHANGHGWQPIPGDAGCSPTCETGEDGNWWALYYTGLNTLSNQAGDMAARAQLLRSHAYAMSGFATTPAHERVPAPIITSTAGARLLFEGSAGSPAYTIQKQTGPGGWTSVCNRCTTDSAGGWTDPSGKIGCYRIIAYNLDGVAGPPSARTGIGCAVVVSTCRSNRSARFILPRGARRVRVRVDGKPRTLRRRGRTLLLPLQGLPRRAVRVRITAAGGYKRTWTIHPCA